jgi:hypothetical protein
MRILLITSAILLTFSVNLLAQQDFKTLDKESYDYYLKDDYKNLKKTTDLMLSQGIDYYYLRMRMGILAYNKQLFYWATKNFSRALEFNSSDTISREYIYDSYVYSGRNPDAGLYLGSILPVNKNNRLKSEDKPAGLSEIFSGSSVSGNDVALYSFNNLNYEAVKSSLGFYAGVETFFSNRLRGTFAYTRYQKTGTVYSGSFPSGTKLDFTQNQVYFRLTRFLFPGWEISGFSHIAFYSDIITSYQKTSEYLGGVGISKNGWKIRSGANLSISNFSYSNQVRGEGYITWLPSGNLNLYLTTGWMGQSDKNWNGTYQINQELGFRVLKFLWLETGIIRGNSFLYARNQGYIMHNSLQIPSTTIYGNIIMLAGRHFSISLTPFFTENLLFSWDFKTFRRTDKVNVNSFGGAIKIIYKNK